MVKPRRTLALLAGAAGTAVGASLAITAIEQRPRRYEVEPIALEGRVLHTGDHFGLPVDLEVAGGALLVIDRRGEKNLHVIDVATGRLLTSVGNPGEGPAEFMAPATITHDRQGRVWIFDTTTQRMTRIDLARLDESTAWADSSIELRGGIALDVSWTSDMHLIAGGAFENGRFGLLDGSGMLMTETGTFPGADSDLPVVIHQQTFQSRIAPRPDGRRFAVAARYAGRIDLVGERGEPLGEVAAPVPFAPGFVVMRKGDFPVAAFPPESVMGYIDVTATGNLVLGLFSGRTEADFPGRDVYGRDIHVFDWSGALVAILRTDRDLLAITVDEERRRLLAITHDPVPAILTFDLPELAPGGVVVAEGPPRARRPQGERSIEAATSPMMSDR